MTAQTSYDEVPYESSARYYSHPDRLGTLATLMGMQPAPVDRCRVLELGAGTGGNLIPMAATLPDSRFVGIDLSARQIAIGQELVSKLQLTNIDLKALSILDVDDSLGQFDYIICHGVWSWVSAEVRAKILTICRNNLAPEGIAFVSYNTFPGWHMRGLAREMMNYHVRQFDEPQRRVQQARAFLNFLIRATADQDGALVRILKQEAELISERADFYIYHEHLEEVNQPMYFWEFIEQATAQGLQYVGEAQEHSYLGKLAPETATTLRDLATDQFHLEQYYDFLFNRVFRQTLLCHREVSLQREVAPERMTPLFVSTLSRSVSASPEIVALVAETFRNQSGVSLSTNVPAVKAAMVCLQEVWPDALAFADLWQEVNRRLGSSAPTGDQAKAARQQLQQSLLRFFLCNLVSLHVHVPSFQKTVSDRPTAHLLARLQAGERYITNLCHVPLAPETLDRVLIPYLDGSRDHAALCDALAGEVARGRLALDIDGKPISEPAAVREQLAPLVEESLRRLAWSAMLIA